MALSYRHNMGMSKDQAPPHDEQTNKRTNEAALRSGYTKRKRKEKKKGLYAFAHNPLIFLLNSGAADQHRTSIPTPARMGLYVLQKPIISMTYC